MTAADLRQIGFLMVLPPDSAARVAQNVEAIRATIADHASRAGRAGKNVRLVAVTKYVGLGVMRALLTAGVRDLGESRVQQLQPRMAALGVGAAGLDTPFDSEGSPAPRWHMIGQLQRNKVKYLLPDCRIVHSMDTLKLAETLAKRAAPDGVTVDVFVEVNVAGERQKGGVAVEELPRLIEAVTPLPHVAVRGLMTMAPYDPDPENARPVFAKLRGLLGDLRDRGLVDDRCCELSMGMSGDYAVAVEEGATIVRVGSALAEGLSDEEREAD
jgi:hypothetical protein